MNKYPNTNLTNQLEVLERRMGIKGRRRSDIVQMHCFEFLSPWY